MVIVEDSQRVDRIITKNVFKNVFSSIIYTEIFKKRQKNIINV